MKIEKNGKKEKFSEIWNGDCFMNNNGYFMKMSVSDDESGNAISLEDADIWHFNGDEMVIPVNAKVVIE